MTTTNRSKFEQREALKQSPLYKRLETAIDQLYVMQDNLEPLLYTPLVDPVLIKDIINRLTHARVSVRTAMRQMLGDDLDTPRPT